MADFLHELSHNKTERGYSTPAWRAYFNQNIQRLLTPAEESDDPWGPVIVPDEAEHNVHYSGGPF
jgi:hypothetical protein